MMKNRYLGVAMLMASWLILYIYTWMLVLGHAKELPDDAIFILTVGMTLWSMVWALITGYIISLSWTDRR